MRVVISIDECKPHWAIQQGLDKAAEALGMRNITVSGDFDSKLALIYGNIDNFESFKVAMDKVPGLNNGSLCRVQEPRPKYQFEIDTGGVEASGYEDRLPWVSYGTIVAEGNTLDECLLNASVDLVDQDGGNPACSPVEADEDWMQDMLIEEFYKGTGQRMENETIGDFRARMDSLLGVK